MVTYIRYISYVLGPGHHPEALLSAEYVINSAICTLTHNSPGLKEEEKKTERLRGFCLVARTSDKSACQCLSQMMNFADRFLFGVDVVFCRGQTRWVHTSILTPGHNIRETCTIYLNRKSEHIKFTIHFRNPPPHALPPPPPTWEWLSHVLTYGKKDRWFCFQRFQTFFRVYCTPVVPGGIPFKSGSN